MYGCISHCVQSSYPCNRGLHIVASTPAEEEEGEESGSVDEDAEEGEEEEEEEEESSEDEAALEDAVEGEEIILGVQRGGGTLYQTPTATILVWWLPSL